MKGGGRTTCMHQHRGHHGRYGVHHGVCPGDLYAAMTMSNLRAWRSVAGCTRQTSIARAIIQCQPRVLLHREIHHRSAWAFDHHQRTRPVKRVAFAPAGGALDAVVACRADAGMGGLFRHDGGGMLRRDHGRPAASHVRGGATAGAYFTIVEAFLQWPSIPRSHTWGSRHRQEHLTDRVGWR
jgi:hypothetical protein